MEGFVRKRYYFLMGFALYTAFVIIGVSLYRNTPLEEVMITLGLALLGFAIGIIEGVIFSSKKNTKNYDYRKIMPIFIFFIFLFAILGPIVMMLYPSDGLELAGVVFVVAGMTMSSKIFLDDEVSQQDKN